MILVNGFPKSGTHALLKAVELLGIPVRSEQIDVAIDHAELNHLPYEEPRDRDDRFLFIKRDPRNVLIS